jgi:Uma2 family endonuclease
MVTSLVREEPEVAYAAPWVVLRLTESFEEVVANNPELRFEQTADGEIVVMSPTGGEGSAINSQFTIDLGMWQRRNGGQCFDSSVFFKLPNGALRGPDAAWISAGRWGSLTIDEQRRFPPIAPDFVAEIRSRTDRLVDLKAKMEEYMSVGVRLGWLIDPIRRQVHVYQPGQESIVLDNPESVSGGDVLPGFVLPLNRIFVAD